MSDCHDRLHPADDRRNQSANATGGRAEKLTNHVMGVTARLRIQPISERFRSGEGSEESALPATDGFALQLDEIPNLEPMRFCVTVRNRFENDPGEIA